MRVSNFIAAVLAGICGVGLVVSMAGGNPVDAVLCAIGGYCCGEIALRKESV